MVENEDLNALNKHVSKALSVLTLAKSRFGGHFRELIEKSIHDLDSFLGLSQRYRCALDSDNAKELCILSDMLDERMNKTWPIDDILSEFQSLEAVIERLELYDNFWTRFDSTRGNITPTVPGMF